MQLFLVSQSHDKGRNAVLDCIVGLEYDRRVTICGDQPIDGSLERGSPSKKPNPRKCSLRAKLSRRCLLPVTQHSTHFSSGAYTLD